MGPYAYCSLDEGVACTYHIHGELVQERGIQCIDIPKIRAPWVQVGNHSQQMCPWPYVPGKFVTKPMSYVAALHLVPNQIRYQINTVPTPAVAWTRA